MRRIITALAIGLTGLASPSLFAAASASEKNVQPASQLTSQPVELAKNAPRRYVVVTGDTLWDISKRFLKDPFRWSEVWQLNKSQIRNPHWIYPGQAIIVVMQDGKPRLMLEGQDPLGSNPLQKVLPYVRESANSKEIPAIPAKAIEPFLNRPLLLEADTVDNAPRVAGFYEQRIVAGNGDRFYVLNQPDTTTQRWLVYHPGDVLKDPDTGEVLGQEVTVIGTAILDKPGNPATYHLTTTKSEVISGDRLAPVPEPEIVKYPLHVPDREISGKVLTISNEAQAVSLYSVVSISRGAKDGVENGQVLGLFRAGETLRDRFKGTVTDITFPNERVGLVYIFRTFDRVSYGLVMELRVPLSVGDVVANPN